ncbi:MAG TPA: HAD family hydrolase [Abditibacteriaceae bacterium]|jgi:HAD superfamily hydrolase (TIGR01548 family)
MELYVKQEIVKTLPSLDAILLDVDGVILDVAQTFQVVASEVAQLYATKWLELEDDGTLFEPLECELFKHAGGFNNDWDLTNAVIALSIAKKAQHPEITTTSQLRAASPDWVEYTTELKRRGGGLVVAENYILDIINSHQRRDFARGWNPKLVTQLFQEMYAGDEACRALYGFQPEHIHGAGYLDKEPVILDATALPTRPKFGILTGRIKAETRIAAQRAGLVERIPETSWVTEDDGIRKPDGEALALLQSRMNFKTGIYIGDTLDDLRVVQNFKETRAAGKARILSCLVLSGPAGEQNRRLFLEAGAEIVGPDVNSVLNYLKSVLK